MKAIRVSQFGGPDVLKLDEIDEPTPGFGEVRIKIAAAGVNPVETYIRAGTYATLPKLPFTPGNDGAGTIDAVGVNVAGLNVGDRVYVAGSVSGTYAEKAIAKADHVRLLPDALSFEQGAGVGVPYITAWRAIFEKAKVQPGETVLVHGGSGAVGLAAIQFLKHLAGPWHIQSFADGQKMTLSQRLEFASGSLKDFMRELIRNQARIVAGTEAAAFTLAGSTANGFLLKPVAHIREDGSDSDTRLAAIEAFDKIVRSCIDQAKEGAIHIEGTWDGSHSQYCLVTLLRSKNRVVAASAVITRAGDLDRARKLLELAGIVGAQFEIFTVRHEHLLSAGAGGMIIATGGTEEGRKLAAEQGAHHLLDHKDDSHFDAVKLRTDGRGVDVVLEMLANQNLGKDLGVLAKNGRVVVIGSRGEVTIDPRDLMKCDGAILGLLGNFEHRDAAHAAIGAGLRNGWLKPIVAKRFALADAAQAHIAVMESATNGKIVLLP